MDVKHTSLPPIRHMLEQFALPDRLMKQQPVLRSPTSTQHSQRELNAHPMQRFHPKTEDAKACAPPPSNAHYRHASMGGSPMATSCSTDYPLHRMYTQPITTSPPTRPNPMIHWDLCYQPYPSPPSSSPVARHHRRAASASFHSLEIPTERTSSYAPPSAPPQPLPVYGTRVRSFTTSGYPPTMIVSRSNAHHPTTTASNHDHHQHRYHCPQCCKSFSRPSSLRIHTYSHTGEKPHRCPYPGCGRKFSVQSNMRRHLRVHYVAPTPQKTHLLSKELAH